MGFLDALTGAGSGFLSGAATGVPHLAGIGAAVGGIRGLFGSGGGSGSSGGGGGSGKTINPMDYLPETPAFVDSYLSDMFGVQKGGFLIAVHKNSFRGR